MFKVRSSKLSQLITKVKHKSYLISFVTITVFLIVGKLLAQQDTAVERIDFNKRYIVSYWTDTKEIVKTPLHWKGRQWSAFAGLAGAWTVTYVYDEEIYNFFQKNRTQKTDNISKYFIEPWGSGLYSIPLLAGIYLSGIKNEHHRNVALTGLKAYLLSGGAAFVIKYISHRHRPNDNIPPNAYLWEGPLPFTTDYTSFPSGHTTTAFAIATVLAIGYRDKTWIGVTSYTVAALVGLSRINDGKHWATDVVAGAALGTFIGCVLAKTNFDRNGKLAIGPTTVMGEYGIGIAYKIY
ncbi:MAG: phosphatase PAP2 family protein [Bacteroidales bacterium]|nr:phosphatase PAP2 family protein [Bacteroidales bacterium]